MEQESKILCCMCSVLISPNPANMCVQCLRSKVNITDGIQTNITIHECRGCHRFLGTKWVEMELESRELLSLCLKKISGLQKVKLIDASWIWTEPHSKRLKIKLPIQKEVLNGAILQQSFVVDFVIRNQQCPECEASYATGTWKAVVQVRQRVGHKRTFFYLEQLILKHSAHSQCSNIESFKDGMDFYFDERNKAVRFMDFLESVVPIKSHNSKKLVTADDHSNTYDFKYSYIIEIAPVCKDDVVVIPSKLAQNLGDISRVCLVNRISNWIHLVDPFSCQTAQMDPSKYWKYEFRGVLSSSQLVEFIVLNTQLVLPRAKASAPKRNTSKYLLADVELARYSESSFSDRRYMSYTHLGRLLRIGDIVLGYDLSTTNINDEESSNILESCPEVIIVRKVYNSSKNRGWRLKELEVEENEDRTKRDDDMNAENYELFLQQLETDKEMRTKINLFKKKTNNNDQKNNTSDNKNDDDVEDDEEDEEDDERIRLDELLVDLTLDDGEAEVDEVEVFDPSTAPESKLADLGIPIQRPGPFKFSPAKI